MDPVHDRAYLDEKGDSPHRRHLPVALADRGVLQGAQDRLRLSETSARELQHALVALGIFAPIAWGLLRLRALSRTAPDAPATRALTPTQIEVLRRHPKSKMPAAARARDALLAVARLGGHLRSNGDPGWIVLGRGYQQLLMLELGFRMGRERCDQS
jgi:hypothetical protein